MGDGFEAGGEMPGFDGGDPGFDQQQQQHPHGEPGGGHGGGHGGGGGMPNMGGGKKGMGKGGMQMPQQQMPQEASPLFVYLVTGIAIILGFHFLPQRKSPGYIVPPENLVCVLDTIFEKLPVSHWQFLENCIKHAQQLL